LTMASRSDSDSSNAAVRISSRVADIMIIPNVESPSFNYQYSTAKALVYPDIRNGFQTRLTACAFQSNVRTIDEKIARVRGRCPRFMFFIC
jgi:hypothetical protein